MQSVPITTDVPPVSSTNKTDRHDIIFLKVTLNTIKQTNKQKSEE